MSIPSIAPYPMPTEADLPENRVSWTPDPERALLLIHDMQRYFLGYFPVDRSPRTDLVRNLQLIRKTADDLAVPVVYTAQPGRMMPAQRGLLHDFWGPGMTDAAADREIADEPAPAAGDVVLTKWRDSAFVRTDLERILADARRDQLIVCGVYANVGCLVTACDAFSRDVRRFFVADAVADFDAEEHRAALSYAARRCAVVMTTSALVEALSGLVRP